MVDVKNLDFYKATGLSRKIKQLNYNLNMKTLTSSCIHVSASSPVSKYLSVSGVEQLCRYSPAVTGIPKCLWRSQLTAADAASPASFGLRLGCVCSLLLYLLL